MIVCKKINADTYNLKWSDSYNWATIVLVDYGDNKQGKIMIQSDWGNYHAGWGSMGSSLREFLLRMGDDYIQNNLFGWPDWIDEEATKKEMLKALKEHENKSDSELESAEMTIDEFFENTDIKSANHFWELFWRDEISDLFAEPQYAPCVVDYMPRQKRFMEKCWPAFKQVLEREKNETENTERTQL